MVLESEEGYSEQSLKKVRENFNDSKKNGGRRKGSKNEKKRKDASKWFLSVEFEVDNAPYCLKSLLEVSGEPKWASDEGV